VPSILPLPLLGGPADPAERIDAYCRSVERLAPFGSSGLVLLTGSGEGRDPDEARSIVVDGLRTIAATAERAGVRIGIEPYQQKGGREWALVHSIHEAVELIADAGDPPSLGIQFDVWHLWNTESLYDDIENELHRFVGVHVCDAREPTRGWADRAFPGEGNADVPRILAALDAAGWNGLYDIEIFSDDGTFGAAYPDSVWALPSEEALRRARASFERCWSDIPSTMKERR
jgi:sugar phosphate isomerase/epimerase